MASENIIPILYLARHGATQLNDSGRFRGNLDVSLNDNGVADAHKLAHYFADHDLSFLISSDRKRAMETAKILSEKHAGIKVHTSENLRALNVGEFSGKLRDEANTAALQKYIDNPDLEIPGGESLDAFKQRIRPCLQEAIDLSNEAGKPGLLVAHSSIVHELGDVLYGDHHSVLVEPGGAVEVYYNLDTGKLGAEAIYKPVPSSTERNKSDVVS